MSSSSSSSSKLASMLCDPELGKLLHECHVRPATPTSTRTTPLFHRRLEKLVDELTMLSLRDTHDRDSVAHVRAVIERLIQQVIDHDLINSAKYEQLIQKINLPLQQQLQPTVPSPESGAHSSNQHQHQHEVEYVRDLSFGDFEARYASLSDKERDCLKIFSLLPEGFVVNKSELFNWCRSLDFFGEAEDNLLPKLAAEGFISRIPSSFFSNYYRMHGHVFSWVQQKTNIDSYLMPITDAHIRDAQGGFHFLHQSPKSAVININNKILNSDTTFNLIHEKLEHPPLVLHLGSWRRQFADHHNSYHDDYIVVDMESLHEAFLMQMHKLRFLSLRGTSGIVHFPDSVSNLNQLWFFDLRACSNLESLPRGIGSLTDLAYLDLSECYLLEHIPKEITSLFNLRVLKGFIINSDPHVLESSSWKKWFQKMAAPPTPSSSSCPFSELGHLKKLEKLTIRANRMDFPSNEDLHTLCNLPHLHTLGITWVGNPNTIQVDGNLQDFPNTVQKLVLQSAPHQTASHLLELIGKQKQYFRLNKLYIRGGWLGEFNQEKHWFPNVKIVRFRYLANLEVEWDQFRLSFPSLTCLEVFQCPNLASFPCDTNGIWKE